MTTDDILKGQEQLMIKYKPLEGIPDWPADIDEKETQIWIKDFFWRITEELGEFTAAVNPAHKKEELIDALHFFAETYVFLGFNPIPITMILAGAKESNLVTEYDCIYYLTQAANCLKNKKWKQTFTATNVTEFRSNLDHAFVTLIKLMMGKQMTFDDIINAYFKKHNTNQERQKSQY